MTRTARGGERFEMENAERGPAPERDLMAAVLQKAVDDIRYPFKSRLDKHTVCYGNGVTAATVRLRDRGTREVPCPCPRLKSAECRRSVIPRHENDAVRWMLSDKDGYLFSFVSICHHLSIGPEAVRKRVLTAKACRARAGGEK